MNFPINECLTIPHDHDNAALSKLIRASLKRKDRMGIDPQAIENPFSSTFFLLDHSKLFQKLTPKQQQQIVSACNDLVLGTSYFIEKGGMSYSAKMLLLGNITEVRQIYALIASDESTHLEWLSPYVRTDLRTCPQGKFIAFILQMIDQYNANTLYYLIQTVLEGWGITYYKTLAMVCQNPTLKQTMLNIIKDEAVHHKTGIALFEPNALNAQDESTIIEGIKSYAEILRMGTQDIVMCFEKILGPLNMAELGQLFADLETEMTGLVRLNILKGLLNQPFAGKWIQQVVDEGYFKPYPPLTCAKNYRDF